MAFTMYTRTGRVVDPLNVRPEDLHPLDFAHALSLLCRYGGHVRDFYSVAQHSVLLSNHGPQHLAKALLLHDVSEAYVGDMVHPLKKQCPEYQEIEHRTTLTVFERYGIDPKLLEEVEAYDRGISIDEMEALMGGADPYLYEVAKPLGIPIMGWTPHTAYNLFLDRFFELFPEEI